ncbi:hypothetical protein H1Z61_07870 [Bacillus aquiflavi]|uniref:DUF7852 domain-containing protein n=1 Tax=Bacillus aquiflavi TaxID=2672567 RepID=A0A6B3VSW7_9BACI|nr:hypothetical protein [Bacillus aquiflavi]MBA4537063.1 hypothetical protein [Bacillus aquiflavi]NEY81360.1 hypothetical protein [Bacillus aquiflavi]
MDNNNLESEKHCPLPPCDKAKTIRVDCNSFGFSFGPTAFIPIVLGEVELQALVESEITLPTAAKEIKSVRRNISLTQCKAVPSAIPLSRQVKVFVSGVIHKNIQYVESCSGYLRDYSVDVPFSCNQAVFAPRAIELFSQKSTLTNERIFINEHGDGADKTTSGGLTFEFFNEPIECRLLFSVVNDIDLHKNIDSSGRFRKIIEKAEVVLIFKLLQKQQVPHCPCGMEDAQEGEENNQAQAPAQSQSPIIHEKNIHDRIKNIINRISNQD